jgi:hypothetical protein
VTLHPRVVNDLLAAEAAVARARLGSRVSAVSADGDRVTADFAVHGRKLRICLDGMHYDAMPFAVSLFDEAGRQLPGQEWPPGLAHGPDHPVLHRPWACIRGTLEYHMYPGHSSDAWESSRGDLRTADILDHLLQKIGL